MEFEMLIEMKKQFNSTLFPSKAADTIPPLGLKSATVAAVRVSQAGCPALLALPTHPAESSRGGWIPLLSWSVLDSLLTVSLDEP